MSVGGIVWDRPPANLARRLLQWWQGVAQEIEAVLTEYGEQVEAYAKANHPWQNITGDAEAGLHATVEHRGSVYTLTLAHGVPYGIWLEVRWGGRYAVIEPTLTVFYGEIMAAVQALVR